MKWQVPKDKVAIVLQDNVSNIVKACRLMNLPSAACTGHLIHLVVGTILSISGNDASDVEEDHPVEVVPKTNGDSEDDAHEEIDYLPVDLERDDLEISEPDKNLQKKYRQLYQTSRK